MHRDIHPTRIHFNNGLVKFNLIGLPYNFKKLLKSPCFSGHVNYSAPEIIYAEANSEEEAGEDLFTEKADIWSLGCCLFYLVTKTDPFESSTVKETKMNIMKVRLNAPKRALDQITNSIIAKCLEFDPNRRLDIHSLIKF